MRRAIILLALIASSGLFLAATPGTAGAANCTNPVHGPTYYGGGLWHFQGQIQACTDVDQIEIHRTACGNSFVCGAGWWDATQQVNHVAPAAYNIDVQLFGRVGVPLANSPVFTYNIPPWCAAGGYPPGAVFSAWTYYTWRIHRLATGTWGSRVTTLFGNENIGC